MSIPTLGFTRAIKNLAKYSIFLSFLFLFGCLDLADSDSANTTSLSSAYSDTKIEGQAVNSVIEKGIVRSYQIVHTEEGSTTSKVPFGLPIRTDINGFFSFYIPNDIQADSILISITADEATQMTCDIVSGCVTKDSKEKVAFGNTFLLDENFEITAMMPTLDHGFTNIVTVNPLTHLASSLAKSQETGPSIENINTSYRYIESLLGLNTRALQLPTPDLTKLDDQAEISEPALKVAVLSASFLALLNSPDWDNISEIIHHAASRISISGTIAAANMGALPEVSLDDLFYQASETVQDLLTQTDNSVKQHSLNKISLEVKKSYEMTMIIPEIMTTIEIEKHPTSIGVKESLAANFNVTALGDNLSYQWRLNNTPISGANEATYIINKTSIKNAGTYDVIVSNLLGSQVSLSAILTVLPIDEINSKQGHNDTEQTVETSNVPTSTSNNEQTVETNIVPTSTSTNEQTVETNFLPTGTSTNEQTVETNIVPTSTNNNEQTVETNIVPTSTNNNEQSSTDGNIPSQNTPPTALDDAIEIFEDTPTIIHVLNNDSDLDSDPITITHAVVTNGNGNVSIQNIDTANGQPSNALFYTPEQNSNLPSTITYTISDGQNNSANARVNLQILPINDAPESFPDVAEMEEDTSITLDVLANDFDTDNDTLTISSASSALGAVEINPDNTITFEPIHNFTGIADINYIALDGHGGITAGIATITVISVNDPPVAINDIADTTEDSTIIINVLSNDSDGDFDELKVTFASSSKGQIGINTDNTLTFTPTENLNGTAIINYTISDEKGGTSSAEVNVSILAVNDAPKSFPDYAEMEEDTRITLDVLANDYDADNDTLTISSASSALGAVDITPDNTLVFEPVSDFTGVAKINYITLDGHGGISAGVATVTVINVNDQPVASNDTAETNEDTTIVINVLNNDSDGDFDELKVTFAASPNGQVSINTDNTLTFTPTENFNGSALINYSISDEKGGSSSAEVHVSIFAMNDSPVLSNDTVQTNEDTPIIIKVLDNDRDADNDTLTVTNVHTNNQGGMVSLNRDNTLTFVPVSDFNGEVSLSYTVNDGHGGTAHASVTVIINPVNDLPILTDHQAATEQSVGIIIDALAGAYDLDGDTLNIIASTALNGKVTWDDNQSITYHPASDFNGEDTISYTVSDGKGGTSSAIITVYVSATEKYDSIELNWERPTKRDDGTLLTANDIKGYSITYGMNSSQLDSSVFVSGALSVSYAINNLSPGIHYFAIATATQDNTQGAYSEIIAVTID